MGTYNGAEFLHEQLDSIVQQSLLPMEIIISDDGSKDETMQVIRKFQKTTNCRVQVYSNTLNMGVKKNLEQAMRYVDASSEYVCFADQDDIWERDKLRNMAFFLRGRPDIAYVFSNSLIVDKYGNSLGTTLWDSLGFNDAKKQKFLAGRGLDVLLSGNVVQGSSLMFRAKFKTDVVPFPRHWLYDEWIPFILEIKGRKGGVIDEAPLMKYRQHNMNTIGAPKKFNTLFGIRIEKGIAPSDQRFLRFFNVLENKIELVDKYDIPVSSNVYRSVKRWHLHLKTRRDLINYSLSKRIAKVSGELLNLNYFRFREGLGDIVNDIVSP